MEVTPWAGLDSFFPRTLKPAIRAVIEDDMDILLVGVGREGLGKSTLMTKILAACAYELDEQLGTPGKVIDRFKPEYVTIKADKHVEISNKAPQFTCHLYDEAGLGSNARRSGSSSNVGLNKFLMICRHLNQIRAVCIPDLFQLDVNVRFRRATAILSVYGYTKMSDSGWKIGRGLIDYYAGDDIRRIEQNPLTRAAVWPHVEYEGLRFEGYDDNPFWTQYVQAARVDKRLEGVEIVKEMRGIKSRKSKKVDGDADA